MLTRVYIDNYKSLVNFELQLQRTTLLLGKNGVGKSAVLDVLYALRQILDGEWKITDRGAFPGSSCTRWQSVDVQVVELDVELGIDRCRYRLEIEHDADFRRARVQREVLTANSQPLFEFIMGEVQLYRDDHSKGPSFPSDWSESALARVAPRHDNKRLTAFASFIRGIVVAGLYPRMFATESLMEEPALTRDGSNFASWYRHMLLEHQELQQDFVSTLKDVIGDFTNIRLQSVGAEARALKLEFRRSSGGSNATYQLRLDEASDGQRALIALYALIHLTSGQGHALFLDEPDNYVTLSELQPWLQAVVDATGDRVPQVVLCSHHPELIDYLGPEHGLILSREVTGVTKVSRAADAYTGDALKLSEVIARGWEK